MRPPSNYFGFRELGGTLKESATIIQSRTEGVRNIVPNLFDSPARRMRRGNR